MCCAMPALIASTLLPTRTKGCPQRPPSRALRRKNLPVRRAPVIALGHSGQMREIERARDAGVNAFILRPVAPATLFSRLEETTARPRPYVETESFAGPDRRIRSSEEARIAWKRGVDVDSGLATPLEAALAQADAMAEAMIRQGDLIAARVGRSLRQYLQTACRNLKMRPMPTATSWSTVWNKSLPAGWPPDIAPLNATLA